MLGSHNSIDAGPEEAHPLSTLSARERQALELASLGLTNLQIAGRLGITVHAVKFHLAAVYRKLQVRNRTEAVVVFLRTSPTQSSTSTSLAEV